MGSCKKRSKQKYNRIRSNGGAGDGIVVDDSAVRDTKDKKFTVGFTSEYRDSFIGTSARMSHINKLMVFFKGVCSSVKEDDFHKNIPMKMKPIDDNGAYKKFYRGISEDVILWEVYITDLRCIYYVDSTNKVLYPLCLTKHPESSKNI